MRLNDAFFVLFLVCFRNDYIEESTYCRWWDRMRSLDLRCRISNTRRSLCPSAPVYSVAPGNLSYPLLLGQHNCPHHNLLSSPTPRQRYATRSRSAVDNIFLLSWALGHGDAQSSNHAPISNQPHHALAPPVPQQHPCRWTAEWHLRHREPTLTTHASNCQDTHLDSSSNAELATHS